MNLSPDERRKVCILTRNNNYNIGLSKDFKKIPGNNLNFALIDDTKFFRKKEIKDVMAFLKLALCSTR